MFYEESGFRRTQGSSHTYSRADRYIRDVDVPALYDTQRLYRHPELRSGEDGMREQALPIMQQDAQWLLKP